MVFDASGFSRESFHFNNTLQSTFVYTHPTDTLLDMDTDDYFLEAFNQMEVGDRVKATGNAGTEFGVAIVLSKTTGPDAIDLSDFTAHGTGDAD